MRILLTIQYDGTNYNGWQIQPGKSTVQGKITEILSDLLHEDIKLYGSGRTDSGVHAIAQKAHFDYNGSFPLKRLIGAANTYLPEDIKIQKAEVVPNDFHAQFSAKKKTYIYKFYVSRIPLPLEDRYSVQIPYSIDRFDVSLVRNALISLIGEHDFKAFSSTGSKIQNTTREIYDISLTQNGNQFELSVTGNGFLYNMIRIIVGTMVKIGLKQLPANTFDQMLKTGKRQLGGVTYPAKGLTLLTVEYPDF